MIVFAAISDREKFLQGYAPAAAQLVEQFGGRYLLRSPGGQLLEGNLPDDVAVVVSEWADRDTAMRFWESPEYREVKRLRDGIADVEVVLIDGELS